MTEIGLASLAENPWLAAFAPALLLVPLVSLANRMLEFVFEYRWSRRIWSNAADPAVADPFRL